MAPELKMLLEIFAAKYAWGVGRIEASIRI
jgi:hypothetical protein